MVPNGQERKALEGLSRLPWEDEGSLFVGKATIASLLEKGWAQRVESLSGAKRLRITEAGTAALAIPAPAKPAKPAKSRLKMLGPRLSTLPPRL